MQLPQPTTKLGHCNRCEKSFDLKGPNKLSSYHKHLLRVEGHTPPKKFTCDICGTNFHEEERFKAHPCTKHKEADTDWTTYVLKNPRTKVAQFLMTSMRQDFEKADVCLQEKYAIPNLWPPVNILPSWLKREETKNLYQSASNTHGVFFLNKILTERVKHGKPNSLILSKNIRVCDEKGKTVVFLPESVTKPVSKHFTVNDIDDHSFEISLANPPDCNVKDQVLDEKSDLIVYHQYSKSKGFSYSPHRYPKELANSKNMFLAPYLFEEDLLENLVGLRVEKFWELCDIIHESPLSNLIRLSPACLALLFR